MMVLKKLPLPLLFWCVICLTAKAQTIAAEQIKGIWITENKDGKVEIYRKDNCYFGKLIWGKYMLDENGKPKLDINNPDPRLKARPLQDMDIITGLVYENEKWQNGKIYDSTTGKTYDVVVTLKGNTMYLRGFIGITIFGKTTVWQRAGE